jgi:hypothetical protein
MASVDNSGYIGAATIQTAAATLVALANIAAAQEAAAKQNEIAEGYLMLAADMRDFWNENYRGCEAAFATETCQLPLYTAQYDLTTGRAVVAVRKAAKSAISDIARKSARYCTGLTSHLMLVAAQAESVAVGNAKLICASVRRHAC